MAEPKSLDLWIKVDVEGWGPVWIAEEPVSFNIYKDFEQCRVYLRDKP